MKITSNIQQAILDFTSEEDRSLASLARELGVNRSTVSSWVSGRAKVVRDVHWNALEPLIQKYLMKYYLESPDGVEIKESTVKESPAFANNARKRMQELKDVVEFLEGQKRGRSAEKDPFDELIASDIKYLTATQKRIIASWIVKNKEVLNYK